MVHLVVDDCDSDDSRKVCERCACACTCAPPRSHAFSHAHASVLSRAQAQVRARALVLTRARAPFLAHARARALQAVRTALFAYWVGFSMCVLNTLVTVVLAAGGVDGKGVAVLYSLFNLALYGVLGFYSVYHAYKGERASERLYMCVDMRARACSFHTRGSRVVPRTR